MKKLLFIITIILIALPSCRILEQSFQSHDSTRDSIVTVFRLDSIYLLDRDSIYIHQRGDTVFSERFSIRYRDRWRQHTDTIFVNRQNSDSIIYKYNAPATVTDKHKRTSWKFWTGIAVAYIVLLLINLYILYRKRKNKQ